MSDFIFFTTPIYYTNDVPHVGHAYSSIIADVMSRSYRMLGREVKFCTWVDENSQKALLKAQELDMPIAQYLDLMASKHKDIRDGLTISYTDFIRTTETRHHDYVQKILNQTHQAGDIYQWVYEGLYCVGCEWFKKSSDLTTEWLCPDHLKAPTIIHENNRFFALSKYQNQLTAMYQQHPDFVIPQSRFTEVKTFVWQGLEDFSASRQTNTFGIPLPRDPDQVTYVRYDALLNYLTVCQWGDEKFTHNMIHIVGKDITRFHAIYRPAMLMSMMSSDPSLWNILPKHILTTGFLTVDGTKMSKSLGNVINPVDLVQQYGRDALVLYLLYDLKLGSDGDFSRTRFEEMYHSMLLGWWWNLVNRVCSLAYKYHITQAKLDPDVCNTIQSIISQTQLSNPLIAMILSDYDPSTILSYLQQANLNQYIIDRYQAVQLCNKIVDETQAWKWLKNNDPTSTAVMQTLLYLIYKINILSAPYFLDWHHKVCENLGIWPIDTTQTWDIQSSRSTKVINLNLNPYIVYPVLNQS